MELGRQRSEAMEKWAWTIMSLAPVVARWTIKGEGRDKLVCEDRRQAGGPREWGEQQDGGGGGVCIKGKQEKSRMTNDWRRKGGRFHEGGKQEWMKRTYRLSTLTREDNRWRASIKCLSWGCGGTVFTIDGSWNPLCRMVFLEVWFLVLNTSGHVMQK